MRNISDGESNTPLTPDFFAETFSPPPGVMRPAINSGLEAPEVGISALPFCRWLVTLCRKFGKSAELPELTAPAESISPEKRGHMKIANVPRRRADYVASGTSSLECKQAFSVLAHGRRDLPIGAFGRAVSSRQNTIPIWLLGSGNCICYLLNLHD
jgi:hypothetical protein